MAPLTIPVELNLIFNIALCVFFVGLAVLWRKYYNPLHEIPGPFLARWTPLWLLYHARRGCRFKAVHEAHKRYGPFVRISPAHVSISDPDAIHVLYGQSGEKALLKSPYYDAFVAKTPSVFSTRDRADHSRKRRLASHAFSIRSLQSLSPFVHTRVEEFVQKLDAMCDSDEYIDTMKWFNYLAFDVISDLAFGEPLGMVAKGTDVMEIQNPDGGSYKEHAIHIVDNREHLAAVLGVMPSLRPISKLIPDPFFVRGQKSATGITLMARQGVMKRIETGARRDDILNKLIEARLKEGGGTLSDSQITELTAEAVTILIAGSHTASSSTAAILHLLRTHADVHKKLIAELDEAIGEGEVPTFEQVKGLPYLQATITEGLRHHGTNAIGLPRCAPSGGVVCCGKYFPEGTELSVPAWTLQHDESIWGDPYNFRPERWLEDPDLRRYTLTFGSGPRTCLGKHIVNMEMLFVLSTFLLRYEVELESNTLETIERFQHEPIHMKVKIRRRAKA